MERSSQLVGRLRARGLYYNRRFRLTTYGILILFGGQNPWLTQICGNLSARWNGRAS